MVATAIDAPSEDYKISYRDGIRYAKKRYRSSEMLAMLSRGKKRAAIRIEPYDDSFVYVYDGSMERWHTARALSAIPGSHVAGTTIDFEAVMRAQGRKILNALKLDRDQYYVAKRKEWKLILEREGIDYCDMTDSPFADEKSSGDENKPSAATTKSVKRAEALAAFVGVD
jgi:hypothetical protein